MNFPNLSQDFAWRGNELIVTSESALTKINKPYLSASTAKGLHSCPAKQVASIFIREPYNPFGAAERGTAGHLIFEILYGLEPHERTKERARAIALELATSEKRPGEEDYREHTKDPEDRERWLEDKYAIIDGVFAVENPSEISVHSAELEIVGITIGRDVPFKGFVDRIDYTGNRDNVRVTDYKTGKVPNLSYGDDHGDQIRIYKEALLQYDGTVAEAGQLIYADHSQARVVDVSEAALAKTLDSFSDSWEILQDSVSKQRFETHKSVLCSWCPLANVCPVGDRRNKKENAVESRAKRAGALDLGIPTLRPGAQPVVIDFVNKTETPVSEASPSLEESIPDATPSPHEPAANDAAHNVDGTSTTTPEASQALDSQGAVMTTSAKGAREEDKPWVESIGGELNLASWAAQNVYSITTDATRILTDNGVRVTPKSLSAFSSYLARMITMTQRAIAGSTAWGEGSATRARYLVLSYVEDSGRQIPFGAKGAEEWQEFARAGINFAKIASGIAEDIWAGELGGPMTEAQYAALGTKPQPVEEDAPAEPAQDKPKAKTSRAKKPEPVDEGDNQDADDVAPVERKTAKG